MIVSHLNDTLEQAQTSSNEMNDECELVLKKYGARDTNSQAHRKAKEIVRFPCLGTRKVPKRLALAPLSTLVTGFICY